MYILIILSTYTLIINILKCVIGISIKNKNIKLFFIIQSVIETISLIMYILWFTNNNSFIQQNIICIITISIYYVLIERKKVYYYITVSIIISICELLLVYNNLFISILLMIYTLYFLYEYLIKYINTKNIEYFVIIIYLVFGPIFYLNFSILRIVFRSTVYHIHFISEIIGCLIILYVVNEKIRQWIILKLSYCFYMIVFSWRKLYGYYIYLFRKNLSRQKKM